MLFQFAALDPPAGVGNDAVRRPVPDPSTRPASIVDAVLEGSAGLVHTTCPGTGPHPISDILAIATAAGTTCRFTERILLRAGDAAPAAAADAARIWSEVRQQLAPFNDGSRRPHTSYPPAVRQALALHRSMQAAESAPSHESWTGAMGVVLDRLATVAQRLDVSVSDAAAGGRIMAYAVDLPVTDVRVRPFLEGHRAKGLVTVDAHDMSHVRAALHEARVRTGALARRVGKPHPVWSDGLPSRSNLHSAHQSQPATATAPAAARAAAVVRDR